MSRETVSSILGTSDRVEWASNLFVAATVQPQLLSLRRVFFRIRGLPSQFGRKTVALLLASFSDVRLD